MIEAGNLRIYEKAQFETGEIVLVIELTVDDIVVATQMNIQSDMRDSFVKACKQFLEVLDERDT